MASASGLASKLTSFSQNNFLTSSDLNIDQTLSLFELIVKLNDLLYLSPNKKICPNSILLNFFKFFISVSLLNRSSVKELIDLISLLTVNPRKIMGFDSDLFSKGAMAEITVIDPDHEWTFDKDHIYSKSGNSPFIGESLEGKVELTISTNSIYKRQ